MLRNTYLIQWQCSLGERENRAPSCCKLGSPGSIAALRWPIEARKFREWRRLFPLPEGEGQGERERDVSQSKAKDHSRNCGTVRVLRQSRRFPETIMYVRTF